MLVGERMLKRIPENTFQKVIAIIILLLAIGMFFRGGNG
jgi:uncharacterized membrane protein YfcA